MSNKGFIVIDRKIMDWKYWHNHTALAIWLYILVEANWKPGFWGSGGEVVDRGELITSQKKIADFFGLDRRTVKRYLELFEQEGQIEIDVNNHRTKIKVVNYAKYQDYSPPDVQQNVQQDVHQNVQRDVQQNVHPDVHNRTNITNKQRNNETNKEEKVSKDTSKKKVELLDDREYWFEEFWKVYPRRVAKQTALKAFSKACKTEADYVAIMSGLRDALPGLMEKDPTYIPHPATWLNQRRWEDEPQPVYIPQPKETLSLAQQLGRLMEESEEDYLLPYDDN